MYTINPNFPHFFVRLRCKPTIHPRYPSIPEVYYMLAAPFGGILLGRFPWMRFITLNRQSHVLEEMITGGPNWGGVVKKVRFPKHFWVGGLVVHPIIYGVLAPSQVVGNGISEPSTVGGFKYFVEFSPRKLTHFDEHIFQRGSNHQLDLG